MQVPSEARKKFRKASYKIVGSHSAVKLCKWTRESITRERFCYKQKWYGIESHRCLQMTPALIWCTHRCIFCWRPLEFTICNRPTADEPNEIVKACVQAQRELISGLKGSRNVNLKKWEEANKPRHAAISLAGEPTLYPRISELIEEFNKLNFTTFLVTNGTNPKVLSKLSEPTQLYISLVAPDKETYRRVCNPLISKGWERITQSLELMKSFRCRKVIRLTLVKGLNTKNFKNYAKLIEKAEPDFCEVKSYMWLGESRLRLKGENMLSFEEIKKIAEKLALLLGYEVADIDRASLVALLKRI